MRIKLIMSPQPEGEKIITHDVISTWIIKSQNNPGNIKQNAIKNEEFKTSTCTLSKSINFFHIKWATTGIPL